MSEQKKVKLGLIGLGNMGSGHIRYLKDMASVEVVGVCDLVKEKADNFAALASTTAYYNYTDLFNQSGLAAVLIAVPHYGHTTIAIDAFQRGLHVLCEKPLGVHVNDNRKVIHAYNEAKTKNPSLAFGMMYQERTYPFYKKLKDILKGGELGKLTRVTWINTAWFRSQAYYDSGGWRATWSGEGGGILTNQCPHNLDTYNWFFGLPDRITGFANIGKYHNIEVEDEVTAYFEHGNGMVGHFIVTTGETPGTNRLEIVGENGRLVYEDKQIIFYRNRQSMLTFSKETREGFANVECWKTEIPYDVNGAFGHAIVTGKFVEAVLTGDDSGLIAHGTEGFNPVMLANGIMLSSFEHHTVTTPIDSDAYERKLKELIGQSTFVKNVNEK